MNTKPADQSATVNQTIEQLQQLQAVAHAANMLRNEALHYLNTKRGEQFLKQAVGDYDKAIAALAALAALQKGDK